MTIKKNKILFRVMFLFTLTAVVLLFALILQSPNQFVWDEVFYTPLIKNVYDYGLNEQNLIFYKKSAPGPGFQLILGSALRFLKIPFSLILIRLINFILFISIPLFITFRKNGNKDFYKNYLLVLFLLLSLPFNYPLLSIGLSDTLALFFLVIGISIYETENNLKFIFSLTCLAIASITRQTFAVFFIIPLLDIFSKKQFYKIPFLLLFCSPLLFLIFKWRGITPPDQHFISKNGINLGNLITHFIYVIILILLTSPLFFLKQFFSLKMLKYYLPISIVFSLIFNFLDVNTFNNRFTELMIPHIGYFFTKLFFSVVAILSLILTCELLFNKSNLDKILLYKKIGLFIFLFSPLFITHSYSSKYLAIITPLWVAILFPDLKNKIGFFNVIVFPILFYIGWSIIENYYLHSLTSL